MNFKNYKQIRMNFIKERIYKGADNWGEYTVFICLISSETFSDYLRRLSVNIKAVSKAKVGTVDWERLVTFKKELKACSECNKQVFDLIDDIQKL